MKMQRAVILVVLLIGLGVFIDLASSPGQVLSKSDGHADFTSANALVASSWGNGKVYFFRRWYVDPEGYQYDYLRYDVAADQIDAGYPAPINSTTWPGWPGTWYGVDAAVNWGNGKAYFFRDNEYLRYDMATDRVDPGYPALLNSTTWPDWPSTWTGVDAAVNWGNGKVYFFRNSEYLRYDIAADQVDPGYPAPLNSTTWPGWPASWSYVTAAVTWGNGKVYFFRNDQFMRYDIAAARVDTGYPLPVDAAHWAGWPVCGDSCRITGGVIWGSPLPPYKVFLPLALKF